MQFSCHHADSLTYSNLQRIADQYLPKTTYILSSGDLPVENPDNSHVFGGPTGKITFKVAVGLHAGAVHGDRHRAGMYFACCLRYWGLNLKNACNLRAPTNKSSNNENELSYKQCLAPTAKSKTQCKHSFWVQNEFLQCTDDDNRNYRNVCRNKFFCEFLFLANCNGASIITVACLSCHR